jgi:hypothetical protein
MALVVTRMDGPDDPDPTEHLNPSWPEIEAAIRRLDGKDCTLLVLGIGEPPVPHMAIGGGEDGLYIVYTTPDNRTFYKLVNPKAPPGKRLLVAGGQRGDYDCRICVGLSDAITAAKTYAETGQCDPTLSWEKQE